MPNVPVSANESNIFEMDPYVFHSEICNVPTTRIINSSKDYFIEEEASFDEAWRIRRHYISRYSRDAIFSLLLPSLL